MRVVMLGWEYPPHISGGLGTACEGLTKALAPLGVSIDFVVPHLYGGEKARHMRIHEPPPMSTIAFSDPPPVRAEGKPGSIASSVAAAAPDSASSAGQAVGETATETQVGVRTVVEEGSVRVTRIDSPLLPYPPYLPCMGAREFAEWVKTLATREGATTTKHRTLSWASMPSELREAIGLPQTVRELLSVSVQGSDVGEHYAANLYLEVARFTQRALSWALGKSFDVVHAHDWMTFPAGIAIARALGIPLVLHVHSLEFDRSGEHGNPMILELERAGLNAADRIIAVSHYTRLLVHRIHGIALDRIDVVHNGVYAKRTVAEYRKEHPEDEPIVLFLGRVTFQKGPDYFVEAAGKVVKHVPKAHFIVAGSGDMLPHVKARVAELGLDDQFEFPGFVKGPEVERLFSTADVYVMPSVSEPFGITALEAMSYETPVILSRQSGASEVLRHALKVDFWDTDKLASQIISVLRYPELRESIVAMAREEVRRVRWDVAAQRTAGVYSKLLRGH